MTDCCDTFSTSPAYAEMTPNPIFTPLDGCNDRAKRNGKVGEVFKSFMPVKYDTVSGQVVPALDGVGAIGLSASDLTATAANNKVVIMRTGHFQWKDVAAAVGAVSTNLAAYWALEAELSKLNIYVGL